jgi:hypothetical protein
LVQKFCLPTLKNGVEIGHEGKNAFGVPSIAVIFTMPHRIVVTGWVVLEIKYWVGLPITMAFHTMGVEVGIFFGALMDGVKVFEFEGTGHIDTGH